MLPNISKGKGVLIGAWIVAIISLVVCAPFAFIAGVFSSDNASGATPLISYLIIAAPILFLLLPVLAQVSYRRAHYSGAKGFAIASLVFCIVVVAYLAYLILGAPTT